MDGCVRGKKAKRQKKCVLYLSSFCLHIAKNIIKMKKEKKVREKIKKTYTQ